MFKIKRLLLCITLTSVWMVSAIESKEAEDYVTDFSTLYKSWEHFDQDVDWVMNQLNQADSVTEKPLKSPADLLSVLDYGHHLTGRAGKLVFYAILQRNIDIHSQQALAAYDVASGLINRAEGVERTIASNISQLPDHRLKAWLDNEPDLTPYRLKLHLSLGKSKTRLDAQGEALLTSLQRSSQLSSDIWNGLMENPVGWPLSTDNSGDTMPATPSNFRRMLRTQDSELRQAVVSGHLNHLGELADTIGTLYTRRVETAHEIARYRGFERGAHAWWFLGENIPAGTTETLINTVRSQRQVLNRFAHIRAKALGLDRVSYADLYIRPAAAEGTYPASETIARVKTLFQQFGDQPLANLEAMLEQPLLHIAPSDKKSAEWGIFPGVAGSQPYLRMNYQGSYTDSRQLAAGLISLLSFYERPDDIALGADDSAISTGLYATYLLYDEQSTQLANSKQERIAFLLFGADRIWRSLFRNTVQMELDLLVEDRIKSGDTPTGSEISTHYMRLLKDYYGDIHIAPEFAHEWMTNYVPFLSYAHHNWPASLAAASYVLDQPGEVASKAIFDQVTKDGLSDRRYDILLENNMDLNSAAPYLSATRRLDKILDQLEIILTGG